MNTQLQLRPRNALRKALPHLVDRSKTRVQMFSPHVQPRGTHGGDMTL